LPHVRRCSAATRQYVKGYAEHPDKVLQMFVARYLKECPDRMDEEQARRYASRVAAGKGTRVRSSRWQVVEFKEGRWILREEQSTMAGVVVSFDADGSHVKVENPHGTKPPQKEKRPISRRLR
jgi:hypothetical protein